MLISEKIFALISKNDMIQFVLESFRNLKNRKKERLIGYLEALQDN